MSSTASSSRPTSCPPTWSGTRIYNQRTGEFTTSLGPVFTNLLLADEINRAPAKVQSALLEVMQERQVTIGRETHPVPDPFLVMATQNPIESEGTYPLARGAGRPVHAQGARRRTRRPTEEFVIVERMTGRPRVDPPGARDRRSCSRLQRASAAVYVDPVLIEYAVRLVTRHARPAVRGLDTVAPYVLYGASPRAAINLHSLGTRTRVPPRADVRPPAGRSRSRARRDASPARSLVRSTRRRRLRRRSPPPGPARRPAARGPTQ